MLLVTEYWGCLAANPGWLFVFYWVLQSTSRQLTPVEMKYAVSDRELVGLRDACLHFRYQLEGLIDLDCYNLPSFQSLDARALQVDDFATSTSVSAAEKAASVHELAAEQAVTSEDVEVKQVSRVSMEDWTQAHAEGYASSMLSDTVELEAFVAAYQDCTDFKALYKALGTSTHVHPLHVYPQYCIGLDDLLCFYGHSSIE